MDIAEVKEVWKKIKQELENSLPEHVYNTWITPLNVADYENSTLVLLSPHQMGVDILRKSWSDGIKAAVKNILGEGANYSLKYDSDYAQSYIKERKKVRAKQVAGKTEDDDAEHNSRKSLAQMQSAANLNLNFKFDNFVVGENSRFAYNAAFSVANNPSKKFNPLFIYGASGLGKTHLLQAIGHYIVFYKPELAVRYIRMEEYFNEWISCFQQSDTGKPQRVNNSQMRKFHQKFQNVDILLMDDIQFIESKMKTMEDFFSTFEALYTNNKQIVIASDRLPRDIPKLDTRLRTRFEMGLVVDITPPAYETRVEIVKSYASDLGVDAESSVYDYIAENFVNNVRELKGAFNKVCAYAEFLSVGLTLETAKKALNCEAKRKCLTIGDIANHVAEFYGVTVKDMKSTARNQKVSKSRQMAIYIARDVLGMSYESIGDYFDKKHTTVLYAYDQVSKNIKTDDSLQATVDDIKSGLRGKNV